MKKQPETMKEFLEGLMEHLQNHMSLETKIHMKYMEYLRKMENFHEKFPTAIPYFTVIHDYAGVDDPTKPSALIIVTSGQEVDDKLQELLEDMLAVIKEGKMSSQKINYNDSDSKRPMGGSKVDPKKDAGTN